MTEASTNGIPCNAPLYMRIATLIVGVMGYIVAFTLIDERVTGLSLVFWSYMLIRMQFYSPDLVVYDSGVELNRYGFKTFLRWQDIRYVRVSRFNSQIFPATMPRWLRILFYDSLLINAWRENYKYAMKTIEERTQSASEQLTSRVYE